MLRPGISYSCLGLLTLLLFSSGCRSTTVTEQQVLDPTHERLMRIGLAYQQFNTNSGRPPAKAEDLQSILQADGADDQVWVSGRDQQALVIVWNVDVRTPSEAVPPSTVIAYERTGKGGKRLVRTLAGTTEELSAEDFAKATFPPGHTPEP